MKPKSTFRSFLLLAGSTLLAASSLQAATITWDANNTGANQTDGAGAWLNTDQWWTGSANANWISGDSAIFGNGGAGGAVTLASPTTVGSLTFNFFTGTYTLGTTGQAITLDNVITVNPTGLVAIASPLIFGGAQIWLNSKPDATATTATGSLKTNSTIDNGGFDLTVDGVGTTQITGILSSGGGLVKNGKGTLLLREATHAYTGATIINGGVVRIAGTDSFGTGTSLTINDGVVEGYFGGTFARSLGTTAGDIQILGGTSGFSGQGATGTAFTIGTSGSTLQWGSAFFSPDVFVLHASTVNTDGKLTLNNAIDLNGATRTIASLGGNTTGGATVTGAITDSLASGAGLIKTGSGNLILTNAGNSYTGATTITGGSVPTVAGAYSGAITLSGGGTINSTGALNLNGGILQLINTAQVNRFADGAAITSAGSNSVIYTNSSGANTYTETLGSITHSSGQLNIVEATNQAGAGDQTLTLGGLSRSGTASATFSAATTGPQAAANKNMIVVSAAGSTPPGQIVGPWATVGTAANAQNDYAVYNSDYVVPAAITGSAETTWTVAADPYTMDFSSAGTTLTATRNVAALRIIGGTPLTSVDFSPAETITLTGHTFVNDDAVVFGTGAPGGLTVGTTYYVINAAVDTFQVSATVGGAAVNLTSAGTSPTVIPASANTLALSTGNNLGACGILNGSPYPVTITPGTGGSVTLPTISAGQLHVTTGRGAITIGAPLINNTGALSLVKSGSAGSLILNGANTFTGDIAINAGTLQIGTNPVANGANLNGGNYGGNIFIGGGANLDIQTNVDQELSGIISGEGNLIKRYIGTLTLSGNNTYTGTTTLGAITNSGSPTLVVSSFNSVGSPVASSSLGRPTTVANGTITLGSANSTPNPVLKYVGTGETTDRIINFVFNSGASRTLDASGAPGILKFTSAFTSNGTATGSIILRGTDIGEIVNGLPFAFTNLTKSDFGTWTLGGAVGNTGTTIINDGVLILNGTKLGTGTVAVNGISTLAGSGTIAGVVTVAATANLTPGTSIGTLTFRNELNIAAPAGSTGKLGFELGPIAASDKIAVAGTLTIGTDLLGFGDFNFADFFGLQNGTYKLITSGGISGTLDPANLTGTFGTVPVTGTLQITGNDIELVVSGVGGGGGYSGWQSANFTAQTIDLDHDNDGVDNGTEYFLGGNTNTTGFTALPGVTNTAGVLSVTWNKAASYTGTYGAGFVVETSETLVGAWATEIVSPNLGFTVTVTGNNVKYTFPTGTKKFARLKVTGP